MTRRNNHDRIQRMVHLTAPQAKVWAAIGGFGQIADWHPLISGVELVEIEGAEYRRLNSVDDESYFERQMMPLVIGRFMKEQQIKLNADASRYINHLVVAEYLKEFNTGSQAW